MKEIFVGFVDSKEPASPVGVIRFDEKSPINSFTYLPSYQGMSLDPVNLNYQSPNDACNPMRPNKRTFLTRSPDLMHRVFMDFIPGIWGCSVLSSKYPEIQSMKGAQLLHWLCDRTVGALAFIRKNTEMERPIEGLDELLKAKLSADEFQRTRQAIDKMGSKNTAFAIHGGAMPKVTYRDDTGGDWIAKFNQINNSGIDYSALEYASIYLARKMGIHTPDIAKARLSENEHIFFSKRYDLQSNRDNATQHKISMFSMCPNISKNSEGNYRDIFASIKIAMTTSQESSQTDVGIAFNEMLKRMVFSVGMNSLDDHLQNHELLFNSQSQKWELSPMFDVVPFPVKTEHKCALFDSKRLNLDTLNPATEKAWRSIARELGLSESATLEEVGRQKKLITELWPKIVAAMKMNKETSQWAIDSAAIGCGNDQNTYQNNLLAKPHKHSNADARNFSL